MKKIAGILLAIICTHLNGQVLNKQYNQVLNTKIFCGEDEIKASDNSITIITKVIYNAIPDGYHLTFTKSFIGNSVSEVENQMRKIMENLVKDMGELKVPKKDIVVDIISLDPVFDFNLRDSTPLTPSGYRITENITFNVKRIEDIWKVSKKCLEYGIYDVVDAKAYKLNTKEIYDSLSVKAVQVLNRKKELSTKVGWSFTGGEVSFTNQKEVLYPSERYLKSLTSNASLYKHHISQPSTLNFRRDLDVDNYFNLNLKDADFVFNAGETSPVIQFYYHLTYTYSKVDTEEEMRKKIKEEELKKQDQKLYIIDKNGNLKQLDIKQ